MTNYMEKDQERECLGNNGNIETVQSTTAPTLYIQHTALHKDEAGRYLPLWLG